MKKITSESFKKIEEILEEANYYRSLLKTSFFKKESEVSKRVELKLKNFIVKELYSLLNVQKEEVKPKPEYVVEALEDEVAFSPVGDDFDSIPELNDLSELEALASTIYNNGKEVYNKPQVEENSAEYLEKEIMLPDGTTKVVRLKRGSGQVRSDGHRSMSLQEIADTQAMMAQQQAASAPQSGIIGQVIQGALTGRIGDDDE